MEGMLMGLIRPKGAILCSAIVLCQLGQLSCDGGKVNGLSSYEFTGSIHLVFPLDRHVTNCPICCDFLFTSIESVRALPCGHYMHSSCFQVYFGMLDALLASEVLPEEYRERCQDILCNDCEKKGTARFHWLYHKCGLCGSYNTRVIKMESSNTNCPPST